MSSLHRTPSDRTPTAARYSAALLLLGAGIAGCARSTQSYDDGDVRVTSIRTGFANAHLVERGGEAILVDAGYLEHAERLASKVEKAGVNPADLRAVVITHGHGDHAEGASYFQEQFAVPVLAGVGDENAIAAGLNEELCPIGSLGEQQLEQASEPWAPVTIDTWVSAELSLADDFGIAGTVVPVPGHTPGSVVVRVGSALFAGDLLRGSATGKAPREHVFMCDTEDNLNDLRYVFEELAPDVDRVFTGHFGSLDGDRVRRWVADL